MKVPYDIGSLSARRRGRSATVSSRGQVENKIRAVHEDVRVGFPLAVASDRSHGVVQGRAVTPIDYYREEKE